LGGAAAAGSFAANAATPSCGPLCINLFNARIGAGDILDVRSPNPPLGASIALDPASITDTGEDFRLSAQGVVSEFIAANLMIPGLGALYGSDPVYEIVWTPGGQNFALCVGVAAPGPGVPASGLPVTLQECGVTVATTWIFHPVTTEGGSFYALINGATTTSTNPASLSGEQNALRTSALAGSTQAQFRRHQLWGEFMGVVP